MDIKETVKIKNEFFATGVTLDVNYRINVLKKLKEMITKHEKEIVEALNKDLGKSDYESYLCEIGLVYEEINYMLHHIKRFSKIKNVKTPITMFSAKSYILPCPYGLVLIMSPWNYPFLLTMGPLIDAITAGNVVVLKPSDYSRNTSLVIKNIITDTFSENYVSVVLGGREQNQELLDQKFDYIFFTGGKKVAHVVLEKASKFLTPTTLELGGKSPCIVSKDCNVALAAKRIVFGKFLNLGQTCVAPDYVLIDEIIYDEFVKQVVEQIKIQFPDPLSNENYGHIINEKHLQRLINLIESDNLYYGGEYNDKKIAPTVLTNVTLESKVMQEEIFGPILPIIKYKDFSEVYEIIDKNPTPLALYLFTSNKKTIKDVTTKISFGGGCINDVIVHLATSNMAFGGVGTSGMGSYHGVKGFETFIHYKSIMDRKTWIDVNVRYQPYTNKKKKLLHKLMK